MVPERDLSSADPISLTRLAFEPNSSRLDELDPHRCGTICQVDGSDDSAGQLMAMGVCVGRQIEVIKRGDPLILRVLGSRLGVSARLARRVHVTLCDAHQCQVPDR